MVLDHSDNTVRVIDIFEAAPDYAANYLRTFFMADPVPDEQAVMRFLAKEYSKLKGRPALLEIGCGPVINHILSAAPYVSDIHMTDLREDNLEEVRKWATRDPHAHSWRRYTRFALQAEGLIPTEELINDREIETRKKIAAIQLCDLRNKFPLGKPAQYQAVSCFYTTEQASRNREEWATIVSNLAGLVAPGGSLLSCAVGHTDHYILYDSEGKSHYYPVPRLTPEDFSKALGENGFDPEQTSVTYAPVSGEETQGIYGVILVSAKKNAI